MGKVEKITETQEETNQKIEKERPRREGEGGMERGRGRERD